MRNKIYNKYSRNKCLFVLFIGIIYWYYLLVLFIGLLVLVYVYQFNALKAQQGRFK